MNVLELYALGIGDVRMYQDWLPPINANTYEIYFLIIYQQMGVPANGKLMWSES